MLKKINYILDKGQKVKLVLLLLIIIAGAFVELLGISSILPIVNVALDPSIIDKKWYLLIIKKNFGFTEVSQMIIFLAWGVILIYIFKNIYVTMMNDFQYRFIFNNQKKLAVKLMKCYMQQDYLFHVSKNVAELQRNVTSDVNGFFTVVLNFLQFLAEFSVCGIIVIFLLTEDVVTTLMLAFMVAIFGAFFTLVFKKVLVKKGEDNRELNVQVTKWILQSFSGIKEIKVANNEDFFVNNYDKNYTQFAVLQRQQSMLKFIPRPIMETVCIGGLLLATIVKLSFGSDDITAFIPTLSVFVVAASRMLPSFNRITGNIGSIMFDKPAIDAVYQDLVDIQKLIEQRKNVESTTEKINLNKEIALNNITFRYPEGDKDVLKNANVKINKNTSVALIGASGAGKTTAADIILGILEPQEGNITVDGTDIRKCMESWHEDIGYIPQTIYLMDDTIRANIAFGIPDEEVDEAALNKAIKEAQLDSFVATLKDGVYTEIGDRGVKLSGGQRQRIGIARALYRNPQILVLDEATSALDNETEKEVMAAIDGLHGTRTLLVIAHRLSTIAKCDYIYEVGNGKFTLRDKRDVL